MKVNFGVYFLIFTFISLAYEELIAMNNSIARLKQSIKSQDIHQSLDHFFSTGNLSKFNSSFNLNRFGETSQTNSNLNSNSSSGKLEKQTKSAPVNLQTFVDVSFKESVFGCKKTIQFKRTINCTKCPSAETTETCSACNGSKKVTITNTTNVEIQPGVIHNSRRVLVGLGDESEDGLIGDCIVVFRVEENPFFKREGSNCLCSVSIPFPHAILGTKIQIPSLYDRNLVVSVCHDCLVFPRRINLFLFQLDPGTKHSSVVRIPGEGFFDSNTQKAGEMVITIGIDFPSQLTSEEREVLLKLTQLPNFQPKPIVVRK